MKLTGARSRRGRLVAAAAIAGAGMAAVTGVAGAGASPVPGTPAPQTAPTFDTPPLDEAHKQFRSVLDTMIVPTHKSVGTKAREIKSGLPAVAGKTERKPATPVADDVPSLPADLAPSIAKAGTKSGGNSVSEHAAKFKKQLQGPPGSMGESSASSLFTGGMKAFSAQMRAHQDRIATARANNRAAADAEAPRSSDNGPYDE